MHRTRIKICGITRPEDARAAIDAGADAIGMILHANAPRKIAIDVARAIVDAASDDVEIVGVFVDAEPALIRRLAEDLGLDQVQLHGSESPKILEWLDGLTVVKALRDDSFSSWPSVRGVLIEPGGGRYAGGNGIAADWDSLTAILETSNGVITRDRLALAGGLRPDTVSAVVSRFRPWTVDVSSGVEQSLGVKSIEKMLAFCAAVRVVDQTP